MPPKPEFLIFHTPGLFILDPVGVLPRRTVVILRIWILNLGFEFYLAAGP